MSDQLHIHQDPFDDFRWTTRAGNHERVAASTEGYVHHTDCVANAGRHQLLLPTAEDDVYDVVPLVELPTHETVVSYVESRLLSAGVRDPGRVAGEALQALADLGAQAARSA